MPPRTNDPIIDCTCYRVSPTAFNVSLDCWFHGQVRRAHRRGRLADIERHIRRRTWTGKMLLAGVKLNRGYCDKNFVPRISQCIEYAGSFEQEWPYFRFCALEEERQRITRA